MITGQWGKPSEVLLDVVVAPDGTVDGVVNPGRQNATISYGMFNAADSTVELTGDMTQPDGGLLPFRITGRLEGRKLRLFYEFGDDRGETDLVRVEEYLPPRLTTTARIEARLADLRRCLAYLSRPKAGVNARRLKARGESLDSIVARDAEPEDIPALAELHVTTWNATYRTSRGPSVATRTRQWSEKFARSPRRDFVVVLENQSGRLIGFAAGNPHSGDFAGELSKIYLRWEYHGLGLGRRLMGEAARRFLDRRMGSFILFAERSNPTIGFYDRMGGERLPDERGLFTGAYGWRDVRKLIPENDRSLLTA